MQEADFVAELEQTAPDSSSSAMAIDGDDKPRSRQQQPAATKVRGG